jgi:hypothetical protein
VADHVIADLTGITQVSQSLRVLGDEFAAITQVADAGSAAGSAELASALTDFATGWSTKRDALIGELRQMSGLAAEAVREYTSTDDMLARALPGTSPVNGPVTGSGAGNGTGPGAGAGAGAGANGARP